MKKRFLAVFLALALCLGLTVVPALAEGDDDWYIEGTVLKGCYASGAVVIPSTITSIDERAFQNNKGVTSVVIPSSVTSIGGYTFAYCDKLESVTFQNSSIISLGWGTFTSCSSLTSVTLPGNLREIPFGTFQSCSSLASITLPSSITSIGGNAFQDCSSLTSISIPNSVSLIDESAFKCSGLTSIEIPSSVTQLGYCAFYDCDNLTSVVIPNSVTSYNTMVFLGCEKLESVTLSNRAAISQGMFQNCPSLVDIVIPEGVTMIGKSAFDGCSKMTNAVIPSTVTSIEKWAFPQGGSLKNVYYNGTESQLNSMTNSSSNWGLFNATIHYSDTSPCSGEHSYPSEGEVTKAPTCSSTGVQAFSCTVCGWVTTEVIPTTDHTLGTPTGNGDGTHTAECSVCQTTVTSDCTYDDGEVTKQPTCAEEGIKAFTCTACHGTKTEAVAKVEHTYDDGVVTTEPTCAAEGVKTFTCSVCQNTKTESIPKLTTHTYDAGVVTTPPTSTTTGVKTYTCTVCHATKTETIPATGGGSSGGGGGGGGGSTSKPPVEPDPVEQVPDTPAPETPMFIDVPETAFYASPVSWAVEKGVTNGTGADTFSPSASCTRKEIVTFLWRAAGSPAPKAANNSFADVETGSYYDKAVRWALENEVTQGTGANVFSPDMSCTRWQVVTFLWRAAGKPAAQYDGRFTDVPADSAYAEAVAWAVAQGITTGNSAATFNPDGVCSRGEIVTFLYRAYNEK